MAQGTTPGKLPREERKVVTAVFADLVGSTTGSMWPRSRTLISATTGLR